METDITVEFISGGFLILNSILGAFFIYMTGKTKNKIEEQGSLLLKKFDDTVKIQLLEGEQETVDALKQLTLEESDRVRVTRFNQREIQKRSAYYDAMTARIVGGKYDGRNYGKLERYYRLTSFNSEENKTSIIKMVEQFGTGRCDNLILRVTADKNDFELLIFEKSKVAALCFHDLGNLDVVHSCMIVRDEALFDNFYLLYQKLWHEDILMEIDFSKGKEHVEEALVMLKSLKPIERGNSIGSSILDSIEEAKGKIRAMEALSN